MDQHDDQPERNEPSVDGPELNQIRVFAIREGRNIPGEALRGEAPADVDVRQIDHTGLRGFVAVSTPRQRRPDWLPFLEDLSGTRAQCPSGDGREAKS
jgi:hypothetical protein